MTNPTITINQRPQERPLALFHLIRQFIQGNLFYVISALFMIAGCYLLMTSQEVSGGEFPRTLKSLLLLQSYELLVIATALIIVRRFVRLDDAFTLLAVEATLLLDPTFFANSFHSLLSSDDPTSMGIYTNIGAFLLVPVKLLVLQLFLRFTLTLRGFLGFTAVAFFVYLVSGPFGWNETRVTMEEYYYLMAWVLVGVTVVIPPVHRMIKSIDSTKNFCTPCQRRWLPRLFCFVPLTIAVFHFLETGFVFELNLHGAIFALVLLFAVQWLIKSYEVNGKQYLEKLLAVDGFLLLGILTSIPMVSYKRIGVHNLDSYFLDSFYPLTIFVLAGAVTYIQFFNKFSYKAALYRVYLLFGAGGLVGLHALGFYQWCLDQIVQALKGGGGYIVDNPVAFGVVVWVGLLVLLIKFRHVLIAAAFGLCTIIGVFHQFGAALGNPAPEIFQSTLALYLILDHCYRKDNKRIDRYTLGFIIPCIGTIRFFVTPTLVPLIIMATEFGLLILVGKYLKHRGYFVIATLQFLTVGYWGAYSAGIDIPVESVLIGFAMVLFFLGVAVTFNKQWVLGRVARLETEFGNYRLFIPGNNSTEADTRRKLQQYLDNNKEHNVRILDKTTAVLAEKLAEQFGVLIGDTPVALFHSHDLKYTIGIITEDRVYLHDNETQKVRICAFDTMADLKTEGSRVEFITRHGIQQVVTLSSETDARRLVGVLHCLTR